MVLYFTSAVVSPPYLIYVGIDKYENEELIKWGWPEDVWFHVDKLSSAHVYLRLPKNVNLDEVPENIIADCAQLVKANSIEGCKSSNIDVVYTMWSNLKKTSGMDVGQVGFHRSKDVRKIHVEKKIGDIVNRLNKTKVVKENVDLRSERELRDAAEARERRKMEQQRRQSEKEAVQTRQAERDIRSYKSLFDGAQMTSNQDSGNDSDDFM